MLNKEKMCLLLLLCICISITGVHSIQFNVLNTGNVYQFSSAENTGENGEPLGTVTCTAAGGAALTGPVTYSILEPHSVPFQLNSDTGVLSLRSGQVLDYEQSELYSFDVSCSYVNDSITSATAAVRFSILPVNEFSPVLSDSSLTVTISELTPAGTILVSRDSSGLRQYSVSDADSGTDGEIRFLSGDNNPPGFELDENRGALRLVQSLDVDSGSTGLLRETYTILVCDGDRPRAECNSLDVSILIRAANDNPPLFEQDVYSVSISESTPVGSSLITVVCTDADRHGVGEFNGITVEPPDAPVYIPNERNGTVILREKLDFEIVSSFAVALICRDSANMTNASLQVNISPENDNTPKFALSEYGFSVNRLSYTGQEIGQVLATDKDIGDKVTYVLLGSGADKFSIKANGTIILNSFIFLVDGSNFDLYVQASDGVFNSTAKVSITVTGFLSVLEIIIIVAIVVVLPCICVVLVSMMICYCRSKKRSKTVQLDRPENQSCLPDAPDSPYIEMASHSSQEALRYRLNSLDRDAPYRTSNTQDDPMRYVELPESWKASNIIINELGDTPHPQRVENIYSEVNPRIAESDYVELASAQSEAELAAASHRTLVTVPETIPEECSDCESLYDDFYSTVPPMDMAVSCPSLPSMKMRSTARRERIYNINKDLDWGTIPESQLKKSRSVTGKLRRK